MIGTIRLLHKENIVYISTTASSAGQKGLGQQAAFQQPMPKIKALIGQ